MGSEADALTILERWVQVIDELVDRTEERRTAGLPEPTFVELTEWRRHLEGERV